MKFSMEDKIGMAEVTLLAVVFFICMLFNLLGV